MAMTKKEKAEFDALAARLRMTAALRWTEAVEPDVRASHDNGGKPAVGWMGHVHNGTAQKAWSTTVFHGLGEKENGRSASQGARALHSSRLLALRSVRHEVELECAKRLAAIDEQIEAELAAPTE